MAPFVVASPSHPHTHPHTGNPAGWTPLMLAASDGFSRVVKILLSRGADVAVEGDYGFTALLLAASDGEFVFHDD